MTAHSIINTIFHAAIWHSMRGLAPGAALAIAAGAVVVGLFFTRR